MTKRKAKAKGRKSNFVLRVKGLPEDAAHLKDLGDGTALYVDKFGTVYATRLERVTYRLLQGQGD